jgi:regulator of sirC expression with transglutaminase-like and TPR domain
MPVRRLTDNDFPALLNLLRDRSDPDLQKLIHSQLREMDTAALRHLRSLAVYAPDQTVMEIEAILQVKVWAELAAELPALAQTEPLPLLPMLLFLVRFGHLDYHEETIRTECDRLTAACRAQLRTTDTPTIIADKIADTLGNELGFTGNTEDYYDPDNSYLDSVLRTRRGLPIALTALYMLIGERVGIPLQGVALPGHFVVGLFAWQESPVFYDPFTGGTRLTPTDCVRLAQRGGHAIAEDALTPVSTRRMLQRMLTNLQHAYAKRAETARCEALRGYLRLMGDE